MSKSFQQAHTQVVFSHNQNNILRTSNIEYHICNLQFSIFISKQISELQFDNCLNLADSFILEAAQNMHTLQDRL